MNARSKIFRLRSSRANDREDPASGTASGSSSLPSASGDDRGPGALHEEAARSFGIAVSKVAIYGSDHPASQGAMGDVFTVCQNLLTARREISFSVRDHQLLLAGEPVDPAAGQQLAQCMERQRLNGFSLKAPLRSSELNAFVALLGTAPQQLESKGGFSAAMGRAGLQSIQSLSPAHVPEPGTAAVRSPEKGREVAAPEKARMLPDKNPKVLDLSLDLSLEDAVRDLYGEDPSPGVEAPAPVVSGRGDSSRVSATSQEGRKLESLLRQLRMLTQAVGSRGLGRPGAGTVLVRQLQEGVSGVVEETRRHIDAIAEDLLADRQAVADLEQEARLRGVVLKNSRSELLARLAELVQELHQPLTVAFGVVDMMLSGNLDAITAHQTEMLKLAAESMEQVGQLTTHLKELVGDPVQLQPDQDILKKAYRN